MSVQRPSRAVWAKFSAATAQAAPSSSMPVTRQEGAGPVETAIAGHPARLWQSEDRPACQVAVFSGGPRPGPELTRLIAGELFSHAIRWKNSPDGTLDWIHDREEFYRHPLFTRHTVTANGGDYDFFVRLPAGMDRGRLERLTAFFDGIGFPYSLPEDIRAHMWSKLLCNTGCNQVCMVYECGYGGLQVPGPAREAMLGAMREVMAVANAEGVPLSERDVESWTGIIDGFPPEGEPSMRQDGKARRRSEVELFSGTIRRLAGKHGIPVPVNDWLYERVWEMEAGY